MFGYISLLVMAVVLIFGLSVYRQVDTGEKLKEDFTLLKNLGLIRKTLLYMSLFGFRISAKSPDFSYSVNMGESAA